MWISVWSNKTSPRYTGVWGALAAIRGVSPNIFSPNHMGRKREQPKYILTKNRLSVDMVCKKMRAQIWGVTIHPSTYS